MDRHTNPPTIPPIIRNPYIPSSLADLLSPIASLSDLEYQYQYSQICWFPSTESELHQLILNGFSLKLSKDDLTTLTSSISGETGVKSWDSVKGKIIDQKLELKAWYRAFPSDWQMYHGCKDMRESRGGEYVRCMQKIQVWGTQHSDPRISNHFKLNKCPCTGSERGSSIAFVTRSLALQFLDECDQFTQPVFKQYMNAINSQLEVQRTLCDFIFGENYINNNPLKRKGKLNVYSFY